ncbi:hypothetical protein AVEN_110142-1 [Araneus ventricosus]|uniref:Uncharacterized protein n=1 Tax=Araneus ventricosus TaxID=182803 RepID=A0A4Y2J474_ARAVE|nr:hypothetical protein AVEN_110142-1 [Araneus ventricosus]
MDEKFEMLFDMMAEMKAGLENKMEAGQERLEQEMRFGQERLEEFDVVSSTNGWTDFVKASQLVASRRGSAWEDLQGIPADNLTDLTTIEKALESIFEKSHLTQLYRNKLKTRRQKPGESLQVLTADLERLMSMPYAECPLDVRESLVAQYFVDAIREKTRNIQPN